MNSKSHYIDLQMKNLARESARSAEKILEMAQALTPFVTEHGYFPLWIRDMTAEINKAAYVNAQYDLLHRMKRDGIVREK